MAYLAHIETYAAQPVAAPLKAVPKPLADAPAARFSLLEWSVIQLSRVDGLSTLREPGRLARFFGWLVGLGGNPKLANPRLEALRRISVLSWHYGFSVPGDDVADFIAAGFSPEQYELLVHSVRAAISAGPQRIH